MEAAPVPDEEAEVLEVEVEEVEVAAEAAEAGETPRPARMTAAEAAGGPWQTAADAAGEPRPFTYDVGDWVEYGPEGEGLKDAWYPACVVKVMRDKAEVRIPALGEDSEVASRAQLRRSHRRRPTAGRAGCRSTTLSTCTTTADGGKCS